MRRAKREVRQEGAEPMDVSAEHSASIWRQGERNETPPSQWDRCGLPGWSYFSEELVRLEEEELFRKTWQLAGHESNIPNTGDYFCFDMLGERAVLLRGRNGVVQAFHNVCPHRGSRVFPDDSGSVRSVVSCPFHGWCFDLDGSLRSPVRPDTFPPMPESRRSLPRLEMEKWFGFLFVRFKSGPQPSIREIMSPHEAELFPYFQRSLIPTQEFWELETPVNWKAVRDVDNEGYHVERAHPALHDLYGGCYRDGAYIGGTSRTVAGFNGSEGGMWSVRHYKRLLPEMTHLPESHRKLWIYLGIFPNAVLTFYPDSIGFYQEFPLGARLCRQRGMVYGYTDEDRATKAARYLSMRIDRDTQKEDVQLTIWSWEAALSSAYRGVFLSDLEYGVRSHHDHLRAVLPVLNLEQEPQAGEIGKLNREFLRRTEQT